MSKPQAKVAFTFIVCQGLKLYEKSEVSFMVGYQSILINYSKTIVSSEWLHRFKIRLRDKFEE